MTSKAEQLTETLQTLDPVYLDVADESHMHSRGLETHYKAVIVGEVFAGKRAVQRHQLVYRTLGALMQQIHALALHTYTPEEWAQAGGAPDSPTCRGGSKHDQAAN